MTTPSSHNSHLLVVDDLRVDIALERGIVHAVRGVSFEVSPGEMIGLLGESGCGKTITALSIPGLTREIPGAHVQGRILFRPSKLGADTELDVVSASMTELRSIRGNEIGMVFQDPMSSLNPVFTVGFQVMEPLMLHRGMSKEDARREGINLLRTVGIPDPEQRFNHYPHQLSGGMHQRVMIAMALSCQPSLLLADEPTTALDVTIQAQILSLLLRLKDEFGASIILITHDMSIVAGTCSRILVMYAGKIVEETTDKEFFSAPRHPYSRALLDSLPRVDAKRKLRAVPGQPPDLLAPPEGCAYAERCQRATDECFQTHPEPTRSGPGRVSCYHPLG